MIFFKKSRRVQRNLDSMLGDMKRELRVMAGLAEADPDLQYSVVHLMANSASERTLVARF